MPISRCRNKRTSLQQLKDDACSVVNSDRPSYRTGRSQAIYPWFSVMPFVYQHSYGLGHHIHGRRTPPLRRDHAVSMSYDPDTKYIWQQPVPLPAEPFRRQARRMPQRSQLCSCAAVQLCSWPRKANPVLHVRNVLNLLFPQTCTWQQRPARSGSWEQCATWISPHACTLKTHFRFAQKWSPYKQVAQDMKHWFHSDSGLHDVYLKHFSRH
jgi:hypothetical protein